MTTQIDLRLYFSDGVDLHYRSVCIGAFKEMWGKPTLEKLQSISFFPLMQNSFGDGVSIFPDATQRRYLGFLRNHGFNISMDYGSYIQRVDTMNVSKWYAHICVLRYLHEKPELVRRTLEWFDRWPDYDPWLLFSLAHCWHEQNGHGHTLFNCGIKAVRYPQDVFVHWNEVTGLDRDKLCGMHDTFSPNASPYYFTGLSECTGILIKNIDTIPEDYERLKKASDEIKVPKS